MALSRNEILTAAIDILNTDSLNKLSMRGLASKLNVKAPSLYFHIKDKNELLEQISELISSRILRQVKALSTPTITDTLVIFRQELLKINESPSVFQLTRPFTPRRVALIQLFMQQLAQYPIPESQLSAVGNLLNNFTLSFVADEQIFTQTVAVELSPAAEFTMPIDMANPEKTFRYELNIILRGISAN